MTDRCVVLGSGIVGVLTAYRLTERGMRVTLVDAGSPGSGTTATGYGHINASYEGYWEYFALRAAGVAGYRRLRAELGEAQWLNDAGCAQFESDETKRVALARHAERLQAAGYSVVSLTRERFAEMEPDVTVPSDVDEIFYYTDEAYLDTTALMADLLGRSVRWGLELHLNDPVTGFGLGDERIQSVHLKSGGRIETDVVVCCCGWWTDSVLALAGSDISLMIPHEPGTAAPGLIVTGSPVVQRLRRMIIANGVNIRPCGGGRLMIWSGQVDAEIQEEERAWGTWCQRPAELATAAMQAAQEYLPALASAEVETARICRRALPRDGLPVMGWVPGVGGLYVIAAHAAVTLAPALAELSVTEVSQTTEAAALDGFRPDRFVRADKPVAAGVHPHQPG
jgi:glycine/D-amino acid oxidase-like deaminating enzyme